MEVELSLTTIPFIHPAVPPPSDSEHPASASPSKDDSGPSPWTETVVLRSPPGWPRRGRPKGRHVHCSSADCFLRRVLPGRGQGQPLVHLPSRAEARRLIPRQGHP